MLRFSIIVVALLMLWAHWRAAYTAEVRAALDELPGNEERLDDLLQDVRDRRLVHHCRAVLADRRAGDELAFEEHRTDAFARIHQLESFAPLRRFGAR